TLTSTYPALRLLSRYTPEFASALGTADPVRASQVDYWIDFCVDSLAPSAGFKHLAAAFAKLDTHLKLRSFLVGYHLTLADLACWGALKSSPVFTKQLKSGQDVGTYLTRWYLHVESLDFVRQALANVDKAVAEVRKAKTDQGSFEIGLKDAEHGKVVTRFPPEPSGYLHVGHAKAALLNDYFAQTYNGKMILRFDDTNPSKEKTEFEDAITYDLSLLGIKADSVSHTSDFFQEIYDIAVGMIKKGLAYCDDAPQEVMQEERRNMIDSKNRSNSVKENLRRFAEMTKASEEGQRNCLRAKINMQDTNGSMRDPVIYRCNLTPHHLTGSKWKLYPTYDLACPVVDSLEGVTHALRSMEYRDRNVQYAWFLKALDLRTVHVWDFSRINFVYTLMSKRKLTWFVENGLVSGWDDPRFPTVRGIRRRGMTIQAIREYILMQGASQKLLELEWDKIWAKNKSIIDPEAPRHTALLRDKITKVRVVDKDTFAPYAKEMPKHKKNPAVGMKQTVYSSELYLEFSDAQTLTEKEEVTFMDWGNVIIEKIEWSPDRTFIGLIEISLNLDGDFKKTKKKLTWLSRALPDGRNELAPVKLVLLDYDFLITKKKLEENDELKDCLNPKTEFRTEAWGDSNLRFCKHGDIIQLERKGYYIVDVPYDEAGDGAAPMHLILIPDGSAASTTPKAVLAAQQAQAAQAKDKKAAGGAAPAAASGKDEKRAAKKAKKEGKDAGAGGAAPAAKPADTKSSGGGSSSAGPVAGAAPVAAPSSGGPAAAVSASDMDTSNIKMYTARPVYGGDAAAPEVPSR
ncbi:hypothetical protein HK405_009756, partial [Cladochytrium tenue]